MVNERVLLVVYSLQYIVYSCVGRVKVKNGTYGSYVLGFFKEKYEISCEATAEFTV